MRGRRHLLGLCALYCQLQAPLAALFCQYGGCCLDDDWKERPVGKATETDLPGVGVRFDLETNAGRCVGVVVHQTGRRDLVIYDERDIDRACESVELTEDEGHTLGELLGGNPVLEHLDDVVHRLEDLEISWVTIDSKSSLAGLTLAEAELRGRTGAGVMALVSDSGSIPIPGGADRLEAGCTAVVVGVPAAVKAATKLLTQSG